MNNNIAIRAENISKQYRLGEVGTGTISHDLNRAWARVRGKEDPFLKIGESNDRSKQGGSEYVWSLRDLHFEIEKGDAVGVIGRNGAGKSTLLKLLSRVTKPTTGHFEVQGRIASLLEVGTGFNPEMTGRENIFLNGAILGMRRHEIKRKFDEIVDFAGVERYIDTPVKRYSSGMYVRLAFAVAAHLESEILIVDEVLAVGDAEFQKKCLGKMGDVSKGEGRTVLFVSHNIAAVKTLCNNAILLNNGLLQKQGDVHSVILDYNKLYLDYNNVKFKAKISADRNYRARFTEVELINKTRSLENELICDVLDDLYVKLKFSVHEKVTHTSPTIILSKDDTILYYNMLTDNNPNLLSEGINEGEYQYEVSLPKLKKGIYNISLVIGKLRVSDYHRLENCITFEVDDVSFDPTIKSFSGNRPGISYFNFDWVKV